MDTGPANPIDVLPFQLGFVETPEMEQLHAKVVAAIMEGNAWPIRAAWGAYLDLAEPLDREDAADTSDREHGLLNLRLAECYRELSMAGRRAFSCPRDMLKRWILLHFEPLFIVPVIRSLN